MPHQRLTCLIGDPLETNMPHHATSETDMPNRQTEPLTLRPSRLSILQKLLVRQPVSLDHPTYNLNYRRRWSTIVGWMVNFCRSDGRLF